MTAAAPTQGPPPTLTRIVATVGPASDDDDIIRRLIDAGVNVFRLNFSHGSVEDHAARLDRIRRISDELRLSVGVLGDLQGPKIRVGKLDEPIELITGQDVVFACRDRDAGLLADGTPELPCEHKTLPDDVRPGSRVLINDGAIRLLAVESEPDDPPRTVRARVLVGGEVSSRKGINLPDSIVTAPAITEQDWRHAEWAAKNDLDFLALSFVRRADEVRELKRRLAEWATGEPIPVVSKIEKPQALDEIDDIIDASDAIMVARGDLGVEMDIAQVPSVQKMLITKCGEWGKPVVVATQMLESMIESSSPTRAEATDVANAVYDGADAVMLSAETAAGRWPVLAVETMRRIIAEAESQQKQGPQDATPPARLRASRDPSAALAHGAWHVAADTDAVMFACWSQHGQTARRLSQAGVRRTVIAYTSDPAQLRRMSLLRGVIGLLGDPCGLDGHDICLREWNRQVEFDLLSRGWVKPGDRIVLMAGRPLGQIGVSDVLATHTIRSETTGFMRVS